MTINSILNKFTSVVKGKLVVGTGILTIGVFMSSILSYVLQITLGRLLTLEDYGVFNSLLSLNYILSVPATSFTISIIKMVTNMFSEGKLKELTKIYWIISKFSVAVGIIFVLFVLVLKDFLLSYLNIIDTNLIYPFAIFIGLSFLTIAPRSYLQGLLRFKGFAFYTVVSGIIRLSIPVVLIYLGYRVGGVINGLSIAAAVSYLIGTFLLKKNFHDFSSINISDDIKKISKLGINVLFIHISLAILSNIDIILVKHLFSAIDAGIYSGVLTIGKIILFGTGIIAAVMFPIVSSSYSKEKILNNVVKNKILVFLIIQLLACFFSVTVFSLFPEFVVLTMFGERFISAVQYVPLFALYIGIYSMINFFVLLSIALEKIKIYFLLLFGAVLQFVLLNLYSTSISMLITINVYIMLGILLLLLVYLFTNHESKITSKN